MTSAKLYTFPAGHLGHLDEAQATALDDFKKLAAEKGYYTPAAGDLPASHRDEIMLRFLRARKFVPQDALKQFGDTEQWRRDNQAEKLYADMDVDKYETSRRMYPQWTGRRDKMGVPVYYFEIKWLTSDAVREYETKIQKAPKNEVEEQSKETSLNRQIFALYENIVRFVSPLCSSIKNRPHSETTPITLSSNIVDISGVGLRQFWYLKTHMQSTNVFSGQYFPEILDKVYIIGAPSYFSTVWSWICRWFDPVTVAKIHIIPDAEVKTVLEKHIGLDSVPKRFGGNLDFEWGDMPNIDPAFEAEGAEWTDNAPTDPKTGRRTVPNGPIIWRDSEDGTHCEAVAIGSEAGKARESVILRVRKTSSEPALRETIVPIVQVEDMADSTDQAEAGLSELNEKTEELNIASDNGPEFSEKPLLGGLAKGENEKPVQQQQVPAESS